MNVVEYCVENLSEEELIEDIEFYLAMREKEINNRGNCTGNLYNEAYIRLEEYFNRFVVDEKYQGIGVNYFIDFGSYREDVGKQWELDRLMQEVVSCYRDGERGGQETLINILYSLLQEVEDSKGDVDELVLEISSLYVDMHKYKGNPVNFIFKQVNKGVEEVVTKLLERDDDYIGEKLYKEIELNLYKLNKLKNVLGIKEDLRIKVYKEIK